MNNKFSEKTMKEKTLYVVMMILQLAILILIGYIAYLRVKTGQHISMPLVGCILLVAVSIFRIVKNRNRFQGSEKERREFKMIVNRSLILAPIIAIAFIAIVVLIKIKFGA